MAAVGLAVPMSMPRYTSAESTLTISTGSDSARRMARSDLPEPVGPINKIARRRPAAGSVRAPINARA